MWFNEHEGNAIAYFNIANSTLVEYQIPSRAKVWGNTSNPLKFALDSKGSVWFTEWTENKIGVLDSEKLNNLSLWLDVSKDTIYLDRHRQNGNQGNGEDSLQIFIHRKNYDNKEDKLKSPINMTIASSISRIQQPRFIITISFFLLLSILLLAFFIPHSFSASAQQQQQQQPITLKEEN